MNNQLLECIPNFSEGRDDAVVVSILDAMASVPGVQILDRHSDPDHNRTVMTLIGSPDAVSRAAFLGIQKAAELIDMDEHEGAHPRIGAADVVPFVPIQNIKMGEVVELSRNLGKRVADELKIPVYLYEYAALSASRVNLEDIRRGEYEGLKEEIETNLERKPDFGPSELGKAGAVVIGARPPLIAFNVYLNTSDVGVTKKIARTIRHSSGGLRFVKAMGVLVDGLAQVSMNLTNYQKTAIPLVVETIRREAQRYGTQIHHSELVGLTPLKALVDTAVWYTQLDQFSDDQILENKLAGGLSASKFDFLDELASKEPTPGGGSAAAFTGAESAALISMVCQLTLGRKKYESHWKSIQNVLEQSEAHRSKLTELVTRDAEAYQSVMAAYRLPKSNENEKSIRENAIKKALIGAANVPLGTAQICRDLLSLASEIVNICNVNAITDLAAAALLARTAISIASANVQVNIQGLESNTEAERIRNELKAIAKDVKELENSFQHHYSVISGFPLL